VKAATKAAVAAAAAAAALLGDYIRYMMYNSFMMLSVFVCDGCLKTG